MPDSPTIHVATEHVQCTGLGWWENRIRNKQQTVSANERQRGSMPLVGQLRVTFFKKVCNVIARYSTSGRSLAGW